MRLGYQHREWLRTELSMWHKHYPHGKTVLDLGAGYGETAQFFLNHGAERVICIESDPRAVEGLRANFGGRVGVEIVQAHVDAVKVDIEGSEWGLVVETHGAFPRLTRLQNFGSRVGLNRLDKSSIPHNLADWKMVGKETLVWQGRKRREIIGF